MEAKPDKHTIQPKDTILGFDFQKMVVIKSAGYTTCVSPVTGERYELVCIVEPITATQIERLTDCFLDDLARGRT